MALNGPLILRDAQGKLVTGTGSPVGFNGGTPVTIDRKLTVTDQGGPWKVAGLEYDVPTKLAESITGPAVNWIAGVPLNAGGEVWAEDAPVLFYAPNAIPITASGAVAMSVGLPPDTLPPLNTADSVTTSDNFTFVLSADRILTDDIFTTESVAFSGSTTQSDTVTSTDSAALLVTKAFADPVASTDAANKSVDKGFADPVTVTDSFSQTFSTTLTDSAATTDNVVIDKGVSLALTDNVSTVDNANVSAGSTQSAADSASTTESITFASSPALADSATTVDAIASSLSRNLSDSVSTVDNATLSPVISQPLADSASTADSVALTPSPSLADGTSSVDSITTTSGKNPSDSAATVDSIASSVDKALSDSAATVDNASTSLTVTQNITDNVTTSDNFTGNISAGSPYETIKYVGGMVGNRAGATSTLPVTFALTGTVNPVPLQDDLVIVTSVVASSGTNGAQAIVTPAGYTALGQLNQAAATNDVSMNVSYKFMTSTPDTSVTIPACVANTDGQAYTIQVFRNVDKTTPMDVTAVSAGGTGTGLVNPGAITPVTPGATLVICGGGAAATGANYIPPPYFPTNFLTSFGVDNFDAMVGSGYIGNWVSGAVDPGTYSGGTANAADSWAAYTLALRPAAAIAHAVPGDLFAAGELGGWWDPSDFTTLFQDTAGTTAVTTAGQSVARINDKSGRGTHLTQATSGSRPTIDCRVNKINVSEDLTNAAWTTSAGSVSANAIAGPSGVTSNMAEGFVGDTSAVLHYLDYVLPNVATATEKNCYSVYVHAGQAGALGGMALIVMSTGGSEMRCGLTLSTGVVTQEFNTFTGTSNAYGCDPITADGWYRIWISGNLDTTTVTRRLRLMVRNTAGQGGVACDGTSIQFYATAVQVEPGIGPPTKYQRVDSASSYDTVGFPWYLNFDGVDDFMSAPLDFSTVSKSAIWAGIYKGSDANFGSCVGLTADPSNTAGSFHLTAPDSAGSNNYGWGSRGNVVSAGANTGGTVIAAGDLSVISGTADIAADSKILRRNGAQAGTSAADQGTGNYANSTLYVGERGGTSFPFTGRLYGLIVRGAATQATTAQIRDIEQWMSAKSGLTFP